MESEKQNRNILFLNRTGRAPTLFSYHIHVCVHVCNNQNKLIVCQADVSISSLLKSREIKSYKDTELIQDRLGNSSESKDILHSLTNQNTRNTEPLFLNCADDRGL